MRKLVWVAAALVIPGATAMAQSPTPLQPGQRVRVISTVPDTPVRTGVISGVYGDTIILRRTDKAGDGLVTPIPMASLAKLEVSRGRHSRWQTGLGIGFGIGAVTGAILGASSDDDLLFSSEDKALMVGTFMGTVGATVGVVAGALTHSERWETFPVDRVTLKVAPGVAGRFNLGVKISLGR